MYVLGRSSLIYFHQILVAFLLTTFTTACLEGSKAPQAESKFDCDEQYETLSIHSKSFLISIQNHVNAKKDISRVNDFEDRLLTEISGDGLSLFTETSLDGSLPSYYEDYFGEKFRRFLLDHGDIDRIERLQNELGVIENMAPLDFFRWLYSGDSIKDDNADRQSLRELMYRAGIGKEKIGKTTYGELDILYKTENEHEKATIAWVSLDHDDSPRNKGKLTILFTAINDDQTVMDGTLFADRDYVDGVAASKFMEIMFTCALSENSVPRCP